MSTVELMERLVKLAERLVNPPTYSEKVQPIAESIEVLGKLLELSKEVSKIELESLRTAAAVKQLEDEVKKYQVITILAILASLAAAILAVIY